MNIRPLSIKGAYEVTPTQHRDQRGQFWEWYRFDELAAVVGHPLELAQANVSVSHFGVVRGIHFTDVPPGQAKYISCLRGTILDCVVDVRVGSVTFGQVETVRLDETDRRSVYLAEGLGHAACALTEEATLAYLCSATYAPDRDRSVDPLDPELAITWPVSSPLLSPKDSAAPSLARAHELGTLPDNETCERYYRQLRSAYGANP